MAERKTYDVFISYSRKDYVDDLKNVIPGNEVSKIKDALKQAGITYWFDEEGIYSGQNFVERIVTNIENARIFVFLSTANANSSPWTCKEIASADEFRKHIIPVRIDASPYNKKVLFRIADLDYIEYYTNPAKGLEDLIKSINAYLSELAAEERHRKEEADKKEEERRRQKEQEAQRLREAQARLVSEIKLSCTALNNEEAKLELDRANLLLKAERIIDSTQRAAIVSLIKTSGPIHKRYEQDYAELAKERERLEAINSDIKDKDNKILQLEEQLIQSRASISSLQEENSNLAEQISFAEQDSGKKAEEKKAEKRKPAAQQEPAAPRVSTGKGNNDILWILISAIIIGIVYCVLAVIYSEYIDDGSSDYDYAEADTLCVEDPAEEYDTLETPSFYYAE